MNNYLFEDLENGGYFFVQCADESEIDEILLNNGFDPNECLMLAVFDDIDAEALGYDTY